MFVAAGVELGAAAQGLKHQLFSDAARKAHVHAGVDHSFHKQEHISRTSARERRGHIQVNLILHKDFLAHAAEYLRGSFFLDFIHLGGTRPDGDTHTDAGRGVWHGAHDAIGAQLLAQGSGGNASYNGNHECSLFECRTDNPGCLVQTLRLDRQDNHIGRLGCCSVIQGDAHGEFLCQFGQPVRIWTS